MRDDWDGCCPGQTSVQVVEGGKAVSLKVLKTNPADTYVWRIKRDGGTITIERSDDGVIFSLLDTHTFGPQINGVLQFFGIGYDSYANVDAYADFDYVRLTKIRD
jgi:hypothetical protein